MSEVDNAEEYVTEARSIVEQLLERRDVDELRKELTIVDIEADSTRFSKELTLLKDLGLGFPAVRIEDELVPQSLELPWLIDDTSDYDTWRFFPPFEFLLNRRLRDHESIGEPTLSPNDARESFTSKAISFLANRIATVVGGSDGRATNGLVKFISPISRSRPPSQTTGAVFTVTSVSPGLRVFRSGAYYLRRNGIHFGSPTTPVAAYLPGGHYVFGVDGGQYTQVTWDTSCVVTVPASKNVHLQF